MHKTFLPRTAIGSSALLAATFLYSVSGSVSAKPVHEMKPIINQASLVRQGKVLTTKFGCVRCHGANLEGKPEFSPSLLSSGILKKYNQASFVKVMLTGITSIGAHVRAPMPVYGHNAMGPSMTKQQAIAIYADLKTLK